MALKLAVSRYSFALKPNLKIKIFAECVFIFWKWYKPIGVSEYKIAEEITDKKIKEIVPSADEIESISIN